MAATTSNATSLIDSGVSTSWLNASTLLLFGAGAFAVTGVSLLAGSESKLVQMLVGKPAPKYQNRGLLTRAQVNELHKQGSWERQVYDEYVSVLLDEERVYPCIYATKGLKADNQRYLFIDSDDHADPRHARDLAATLAEYLPQSRELGANTSLVLLSKHNPRPRSMETYKNAFWMLLNNIASLDTKPWPENIPRDIDTDRWCFCFGGEPFFAVIQTPAHQTRASRHADSLTVVFQPKWIFDVLFSSEAKKVGAIAKVRSLLAEYDPIAASPDLLTYGDEGSRESKQYFLLDENSPASCPFSVLGT
ncbi:hypothetical protein FIBSPDRAFT_1044482 [Athelia psychrophila]|uniref:YqcI/YcgG family protein n=1 Tax=Athelia psychrophila TaxID=1759441 RepID=A0A166JIN3_9AGAM|nr:hypothetical protein FIBSPDRAFT_1044482 [Fibularhizoctonia sp. CBS 109695]